eukprot:3063800-Prymnesium_polylepis.2
MRASAVARVLPSARAPAHATVRSCSSRVSRVPPSQHSLTRQISRASDAIPRSCRTVPRKARGRAQVEERCAAPRRRRQAAVDRRSGQGSDAMRARALAHPQDVLVLAEGQPRANLVANQLRVGRLHRRRQALDCELFTGKAAARAPLDGAKTACPEAGAQP